MFCNKKKCVIHFHLRRWTCWTAAWNLFSNDMFYHTLCQSEVFTPHIHSDTPDTHLYKALSQKNTSPGSPVGQPTVNFPLGSIGHDEVVKLVITRWWSGSRDQQESHLCLSTSANQRWMVTPNAYMSSDVSTAATTRVLPVLSLSARVISCHERSVCKDKHPCYTISHF